MFDVQFITSSFCWPTKVFTWWLPLTLLQKSIEFFNEVQWLSGSLVWIYDIIVSYEIMILGHGEWTMGIWLLSLNWLFLIVTKSWVLSWYLMTIITWVLIVNTNKLLFVFTIHVCMDMEILKPSTNFLLGFPELRFIFPWWTNIFFYAG